ncbi:hypothetical protein [Burkholderia ubonensis]|uniref:hypothetical protein n=1 Tax=Burkholderia ubonensis TaxID=101571 RepID=UPI000A42B627|nr:hypothetical protein [Burkholderia ubonensis]
MPSRLPIGANDYYDSNPETRHSAGDIWVNLPTYGLLGMRRRAGIVITPPCDLAQGKVETITYLPIVSLGSYFSTSAFLPVVMRELRGQLTLLQIDDLPISNGRFSLPPMEAMIRVEMKLQEIKSGQKTGAKEKASACKATACLEILKNIYDGELSECGAQTVCDALGSKYAKNLYENLIKNSHAIDLHFLPKDGQPTEWSAIEYHSLVLFRYPITAPVELFDEAQEVGTRDWHSAVARVAKKVPAAAAFAETRPMKRALLKSGFFADLLTRYAAMHVRVGSPDFTQTTVGNYISDLGFPK